MILSLGFEDKWDNQKLDSLQKADNFPEFMAKNAHPDSLIVPHDEVLIKFYVTKFDVVTYLKKQKCKNYKPDLDINLLSRHFYNLND